MMTNRRAKRDAKQLLRLCIVNGELDQNRIRLVVERAISAHYRASPLVLDHFLRFVRIEHGRRTAVVESAVPLAPELRSIVEGTIARRYGPGLKAEFTEEPALIGGVRIRVGSDLFDGSVRAGLESLEKKF
jgi:F-type H+-transporting ATPase subunit delta